MKLFSMLNAKGIFIHFCFDETFSICGLGEVVEATSWPSDQHVNIAILYSDSVRYLGSQCTRPIFRLQDKQDVIYYGRLVTLLY